MYYQNSGRFSAGGLLLGLFLGCLSALVLAYGYGNWLHLIPEAHFAAFATLAFGVLVGAGTGLGMVWGHVRNKTLAIATATITTGLALYISWAFWIRSVLRHASHKNISWTGLIEHPRAIWFFMRFINQYGTWTIDGGTATKGWALWVVWALEAVIVPGVGIAAAVGIMQLHPYCEACGHWCRRAARLYLSPVQSPQQLKQQLEKKDLHILESLTMGVKTADHLSVTLESCESCSQFHTLSATQVYVRRRKFGQPQVSQKKIVQHLIVDPVEAQKIRQIETNAQMAQLTSGKAHGVAAGGQR